MKNLLLVLVLLLSTSTANCQKNYLEESNEDFAQRMKWFTDAKYGMFIHFGLYSQLGGVWQGEIIEGYPAWIQALADINPQEYAKLTHTFNPTEFDSDFIVSTAKKAGMKYLVVTTKHHDGFCLWDSKYTDFDIANTPLKRDIVKELADACRKYDIHFGTYYSIIDWHHPSQERNLDTTGAVCWLNDRMKTGKKQQYITYMKKQIKELIENYDTEIIWFDGDWVYWWDMASGIDLYNYIRKLKPEIIINNRVAKRDDFKKDFGTPEQFHLEHEVEYDWEACYTLNNSWGYKESDRNWKDAQTVYDKLMDINGKGGNFLLNVGPDGNGKVPKASVDILLEVGKMLNK